MDPELRRYLQVVVALLSAIAVATVWLLVETVGSVLPVVFVAVLALVLAEVLLGYVSTLDQEIDPTDGGEEETGPSA